MLLCWVKENLFRCVDVASTAQRQSITTRESAVKRKRLNQSVLMIFLYATE
jgi:hypothetical protein